MKSRKISTLLTPLVVASLLLVVVSFPNARASQRRRRPARTTPTRPAAQPAPQTGTQTPTRTDAQRAAEKRRAEPERSIEEMLSADAYGTYAEVRRVGTLAQAEEIRTAVGALQLFGDETKPLTDLFGFIKDNSEELADARAVLLFMPTRAELPQTLLALELPSVETAAAFEPKFRRLIAEQVKTFKDTGVGPQASPARPNPTQRSAAGRDKTKADAVAGLAFKRVGRWLLAADSPFTLKRLRGTEDASALSENVRFQSARTRFGSDSLFVYVDTTLAQQGWAVQRQREEEARAAAAQSSERTRGVIVGKAEDAQPTTTAQTQTPVIIRQQPAPTGTLSPTEAATAPTPEETTPNPDLIVENGNLGSPTAEEEAAAKEAVAAAKPSEEEMASWQMRALLGSMWGGIPRVPGALALGVGLEAGALKIRLAVENTSDGTINLIPFLPNIVAGAPVTAEAATVAPADADIFFTTSVDWTQIYTSTMGTAAMNPSLMNVNYEGDGDEETAAAGKSEKIPTADEAVASVEKLFGFKFKEDLLPALGNEVSVSLPFDIFNRGFFSPRAAAKKDEKDSEPGFVVIIALNNPDKVREILPRVLVAFNFITPQATFAPPERREGFEIRRAGDFAYTIINNFLVASENVKAVRHVVDSYASRQTLATTNTYRDTTAWQARQKLVQAYVSEALMREIVGDTKKRSGASTDPSVRLLLTQLDAPPEPASYETTNEGDVLVHELRLPISMIKTYAVTLMVAVKDAPITSNEGVAVFALNRIEYAEEAYKKDKKKERYGTLEELYAEELLEKDFIQQLEYKIELNVTNDKFEATATPKSYGKTGRRSFFVDETGQTRAADHKGKPATADDPPVD